MYIDIYRYRYVDITKRVIYEYGRDVDSLNYFTRKENAIYSTDQ